MIAIGLAAARPFRPLIQAWLQDKGSRPDLPAGYVDDASRMNSTHAAEIVDVAANPADAEEQLRALLQRARKQHLKVAISGARHTMGGHTIYPEGIALNMLPFNHLEFDAAHRLLRAGAGARWSEVVPFLDERGYSVAVMQSNNDFSIGGSLSANCHGWQVHSPPIASTVPSFRLMKADGTVVTCSRKENPELFALALGGYGLFGVILDAELTVVPNERYQEEAEVIPVNQYAAVFHERVSQAADVGMAYGRLCVVPGDKDFLRHAILTVYRRAPCKKEEIPKLRDLAYATLRREIYRSQLGNAAGKELRWLAETRASRVLSKKFVSRNQLINEGVSVYAEQGQNRTDILHEYFVPPERLNAFLDLIRPIIAKHHGDLLNVTVRHVLTDQDTVLRYADREMFSFVMLFSQQRSPDADSRMEAMTRELIDAALAREGRYYLPYRLHATASQFSKAYPQARDFFQRKRQFDSDQIFENQFYLKYGLP
jgi:FAD/FMN-containing dehydrogenase